MKQTKTEQRIGEIIKEKTQPDMNKVLEEVMTFMDKIRKAKLNAEQLEIVGDAAGDLAKAMFIHGRDGIFSAMNAGMEEAKRILTENPQQYLSDHIEMSERKTNERRGK